MVASGWTPQHLHQIALAHAHLHLGVVAVFVSSTVITIDLALFGGQDRGRRHHGRALERGGNDRSRGPTAPARSCSPGLSACTQTCTVVLLGSTAGLTMVTRAGDGRAAVDRRQRRLVADLDVPGLLLRELTRATTDDTSITVSIGVPAFAISPG